MTFLLLITLFAYNHILLSTFMNHGSNAKADTIDPSRIQTRFEPWLWKKIQTLKSNGTTTELPLIIRLAKTNDSQIEELKNSC